MQIIYFCLVCLPLQEQRLLLLLLLLLLPPFGTSPDALSTLDAIKVNVRAVSVTFAIVACVVPPLIHPLIIPPTPSLCNPLAAAHPLLLLLYLGLYFCFFFSFCCCFPCFLFSFPLCCFFFSFFFVFCVFFSCASSGQQKNATTTRKKKIIYIIRTDVQNVGKSPAPFARLRLAWVVPLPLQPPLGNSAWSLTCSLLFCFCCCSCCCCRCCYGCCC